MIIQQLKITILTHISGESGVHQHWQEVSFNLVFLFFCQLYVCFWLLFSKYVRLHSHFIKNPWLCRCCCHALLFELQEGIWRLQSINCVCVFSSSWGHPCHPRERELRAAARSRGLQTQRHLCFRTYRKWKNIGVRHTCCTGICANNELHSCSYLHWNFLVVMCYSDDVNFNPAHGIF